MIIQLFSLSVGQLVSIQLLVVSWAVHERSLAMSQSGDAAHVGKGYWDSSTGVRGRQGGFSLSVLQFVGWSVVSWLVASSGGGAESCIWRQN